MSVAEEILDKSYDMDNVCTVGMIGEKISLARLPKLDDYHS